MLRYIVGKLSQLGKINDLLSQAFEKTHASAEMVDGDPVLEALYAGFQISYLDKEDYSRADSDMGSLFDSYSAQFMLVAVSSPIMREVNLI